MTALSSSLPGLIDELDKSSAAFDEELAWAYDQQITRYEKSQPMPQGRAELIARQRVRNRGILTPEILRLKIYALLGGIPKEERNG